MLTIICIIIIIILAVQLNSKDNEILKLKQENELLHKNIFKMATQLNGDSIPEEKSSQNEEKKEEKVIEELPSPKLKETNELTNRNTLILITGSVFIILSAILFLTSTWNIISNLAKTLILVLFIFVFLGISYFAEEKLKIEKTAKAFFYIGMAYIPISLISIAYLKLLGNYFSTVPGIFIYLTATFIITSIIYIIASEKSNKLTYASYLSQILAVVNLSCFLSDKGELTILLVTIYNIAILIKNIYSEKKESYNIEKISTLTIATILTIWISTYLIKNTTIPIFLVISIILLCISTFYRAKNNKTYHGLNTLLLLLSVPAIINQFSLSTTLQEIIFLLTIILVYIKNEIDKDQADAPDWLLIIITMLSLFVSTLLTNHIWISIIVTITAIIINIYRYIRVKWNIHIVLAIWLLALTYYLIISKFSLDFPVFVLLLTITEIIKYFVMKKIKENSLKDAIEINSNIILLPSLSLFAWLYVLEGNSGMIIIPIIMMVMSYLNYKEQRKNYHVLITYMASVTLLETLINMLTLPIPHYLSFIIISCFAVISKLIKNTPLQEPLVFKFFYTLSLFIMIVLQTNTSFLLTIITILLTCLYNKKQEKDNILTNVSYVALTLIVYAEEVTFWNMTLNPVVSLIIIIIWMTKGYLRKERKITDWLALTYILLDYIIYPLSTYYTTILLIAWSIANFDNTKKYNNAVKLVLYFSGLWLYTSIIKHCNLDQITVINLLGYFTCLYLITRTIIHKENRPAIEAIGTIILSLIAIPMYHNQLDGILFVTFLILMMVISYWKKIESTFYTSLVFIIINIFLLTRKFWFSLPWWLYLLVVGIGLILFATNNELQSSITKRKLLSTWKNHFNIKK